MQRRDGRGPGEIRPIEITRRFTTAAPGSILYACGDTRVFVTASVEERVPPWMAGRGRGWVTAEYAMLPGSTKERKPRAASTGRLDGRTQEIQRMVGRALRSVTDMRALGERTVWLDCDVLQADGGTRTACVNAAYIALCDALRTYPFKSPLDKWPITEPLGAVSAGVVKGRALVDLDYSEDHKAEVDMNVVMTSSGRYLEIQGTGESRPFTPEELTQILDLCAAGIGSIIEAARAAMAAPVSTP